MMIDWRQDKIYLGQLNEGSNIRKDKTCILIFELIGSNYIIAYQIQYNQYSMNLNRIQKYRTQKYIVQQTHTQGSHRPQINYVKPNSKNIHESHHQDIKSKIKHSMQINQSKNPFVQSKSMTLRDYMYITSKSVQKHHLNKKQNGSPILNTSLSLQKGGKSMVRKDKYQISNEQILQIVKNDINNDLNQISQKTNSMKIKIDHIFSSEHPKRFKVNELYNIRKMLKESIITQLFAIDNLLTSVAEADSCKIQIQEVGKPGIIEGQSEKKYYDSNTLARNLYFNENQLKYLNGNSSFAYKSD